MKIGINCGHTLGGQPGAGAIGIIDESAETRNVGKPLIEMLRKGGHTVYDCTDDYAASTSENLAEIVRLANAQPLDLFVSVHFNAGGGLGTEVYTYGGKSFAEAEQTCKNIAALGFKNRGIKDGSGLYVIRNTSAKSMLIEVCFVDSADAQTYKNVGYEKIAAAISSAITGTETEYTQAEEIVRRLNAMGIISDTKLWVDCCKKDNNIYWFCRKLVNYTASKRGGETAAYEYTDIHNIVWDLQYRGIISDSALWERYMRNNSNIYWLLRKSLHWCRTH